MEERQKPGRADEETERVTPVESPSENYLVVENLRSMPSVFSRGLLYLMVLALLSGLLYSILGRIDIVTECSAVARPDTHQIKVLSHQSGVIERVFVKEGQFIEKDALLFHIRLDSPAGRLTGVEDLRHAIRLAQDHYDRKISQASSELDRIGEDYRRFLRASELQSEKKQALLDSMDAEIHYWRRQVDALSKEQEKKHNEAGGETTSDRIALDRAFMELEKLRSLRELTEKEKALLAEEREQQAQELADRKSLLEKEIKTLSLEREATLQAMQKPPAGEETSPSLHDALPEDDRYEPPGTPFVTVRAEHEGILSELAVANVGEYVQEHDLLCTILPKDASLYMDITVPNKDIGFIATGMPVKYKFDAFPYTDCGLLFGKVGTISPSATEEGALGLVYHVHGTLDVPCFDIRGEKYRVKPGMTATAELVTGTKSVLSILFSRLKG